MNELLLRSWRMLALSGAIALLFGVLALLRLEEYVNVTAPTLLAANTPR